MGECDIMDDFMDCEGSRDDIISFITAALQPNLLEGSEVLLPSPTLQKSTGSASSGILPSEVSNVKVARRLSLRTPSPPSDKKSLWTMESRSRTVSSEGPTKRHKTVPLEPHAKICCNHSKEARDLEKQLTEATIKNSKLQQEVLDVQLTNKLLMRTIPSVTRRYEEAVAENALLRNVVERLRFHLVNHVATDNSCPPSPCILPNTDDIGLLPETSSIFSGDNSFSSLLSSPLEYF
eukprot:jgi/Botrbrau1/23051/Bobra.136_1s0039.1